MAQDNEAITCPLCGQRVSNENEFVHIDLEGVVQIWGRIYNIGPSAAVLLDLLWRRRPNIVTKDLLYDALYQLRPDSEWPDPAIINVFVCKLRRKIEGCPLEIQNIWGRGYRLVINTGDNLSCIPQNNHHRRRKQSRSVPSFLTTSTQV